MNKNNFENIVLFKKEVNALKKLKNADKLSLDTDIMDALLKNNLINKNYIGSDEYGEPKYDNYCMINDYGKRYLIYFIHNKKQKVFEWMRYIITTVIAITALCISIVKS